MTTLLDARFQEQAIAQWRDWRRFLALQLQLLELRAQPGEPADVFEAADSPADRERDVRARLAAIPPERRALFERALDERREKIHATLDERRRASTTGREHPLDADEVDRAALRELLDEAEGAQSGGLGLVPMPDGWYEVEADRLRELPDEATYQLAARRGPPPQVRLVAVAAVLLAGAAALIWSLAPPAQAKPAAAPILVNEQAAAPWQPQAVLIDGTAVPIRVDDPTAAAWDARRWPPELCLPQEISALGELAVLGQGDAPMRRYALGDAASTADLVVRRCGTDERHNTVLLGVEPPAAQPFGEEAPLGTGAITAQPPTVIGPGQDASLPAGHAHVVVPVVAPPQDWAQLRPTLRLPDGQDLLPSEVAATSDGATLRYLVPIFVETIEVQWSLADVAANTPLHWAGTLEPPPSRASFVAASLAGATVQAEHDTTGGLRIVMTITAGDEAITLTESDIALSQREQRLALPELAELREPLAPRERRTLTLTLPAAGAESLLLSVGAFSFEIAP